MRKVCKEFLLLPGWIYTNEDNWRYISAKEMTEQYNISPHRCLIPLDDEDPEKIAYEYNLQILKPVREQDEQQQRVGI